MFSAAPEPAHCKALKNVFQYLKSVKEMGLVFHSDPKEDSKFEMKGIFDALYASAQRTKPMDVKYHFLRQAVQEGKINLKYVDTKDQLADIFTKMFPQFRKLRTEKLGRSRRHYYQLELIQSGHVVLGESVNRLNQWLSDRLAKQQRAGASHTKKRF
jgi:hypothetical protein